MTLGCRQVAISIRSLPSPRPNPSLRPWAFFNRTWEGREIEIEFFTGRFYKHIYIHGIHSMAAPGGSSSISVAVRVRPFTIREAAQISKCDDGPLFLGDGSLAGAPTPKLHQKGIRSIVKVIDDRCL